MHEPTRDAISSPHDRPQDREWSALGCLTLILFPVLLWVLGAVITQDVKAQVVPTPTVELFGQALGAFVLRLGAIVIAVWSVYAVIFLRPGRGMPRWMTKLVV